MTDDDLRRVFADAWESPEAARASWWLLAGRAVERAARAAAFREAARLAADAGLAKLAETLRARAEGQSNG